MSGTVYSDPLTRDSAVKIARAWCDANVQQPASYRGRNQLRWLMEQMAVLCVAESVKNNEDEDQLNERLSKAHEILMNVWYATAPEIATHWWQDGEKPDENQQKVIDKAKTTVWKRRDPKRSFVEGFESENHTAFDQRDFHGTIAGYLKEQWLRHPVLDWIMLDMMVSRELSAFGEELKQILPYAKNLFGEKLGRYFAMKGDLRKMRRLDLRNVVNKFFRIVLPVAVIYGVFYFGDESVGRLITGGGVSGICVVVALGVLVSQIWPTVVFNYLLHRRWNRMYGVWRLLEGPTVNPTLVREVMVRTRDQGAVWDMPAWSIIDRVIQHDPAVWIVQGGSFS
jgi:hypothetical protein